MLRTLTTLLAVLVLALAGCGGDDDENGGSGSAATATPTTESTPEATPEETPEDTGGSSGGGETVEVASPEDGGLVFEPDALTAQAGEIEITYDNPSTVPHAFAIDGQDAATEEVTGGS